MIWKRLFQSIINSVYDDSSTIVAVAVQRSESVYFLGLQFAVNPCFSVFIAQQISVL